MGQEGKASPDRENPVGIYLHVPFCRSKCRYCHFFSVPHSREREEAFIRACLLEAEAALQGFRADTLYIGGGTPSLLSPSSLERLFQTLKASEIEEVSIEVNPDDELDFSLLAQLGVNRVSIAAISFDERVLYFLGRRHNPSQIVDRVEQARRAGIENINLDLLYGIPHTDWRHFERQVREALALEPVHISIYQLEALEHTALREARVEEQQVVESYRAARELLESRGLRRYEVSNFALPGRECSHNLKYWKLLPYIGLGPSAVSFVSPRRWRNIASTRRYVSALLSGRLPEREESLLSREELFRERLLMGLRLEEGVEIDEVPESMQEGFWKAVEELGGEGFLRMEGRRIKVEDKGVLLLNELLLRLLWPSS